MSAINSVHIVYFSGTGNAERIAKNMGANINCISIDSFYIRISALFLNPFQFVRRV